MVFRVWHTLNKISECNYQGVLKSRLSIASSKTTGLLNLHLLSRELSELILPEWLDRWGQTRCPNQTLEYSLLGKTPVLLSSISACKLECQFS